MHADLGKSNVSQGVQPEVEVVRVFEMKSLRLIKKAHVYTEITVKVLLFMLKVSSFIGQKKILYSAKFSRRIIFVVFVD